MIRPRLLVASVFVVAAFNLAAMVHWAFRISANNHETSILRSLSTTTIADQSRGAAAVQRNLRLQEEKTELMSDFTSNEAAVDVLVDNDWPPAQMLDALLLFDGGVEESATTTAVTVTTPNINNTPNKSYRRRLVVAASNSEFVDFADNFANSLLALNVTNFVLVPLDDEAHEILYRAYPKHTLPVFPRMESNHSVAEEASFGSQAFKELTSTRPAFLRPFLEKDYTVLYNDIDMVWQHNAWDVIDERSDSAKKTSTTTTPSMLWHDGPGQLCTCMLYLLPTPDSLSLLDQWEEEIQTGKHTTDQFAFVELAKRLKFPFGGGTTENGSVRVFKSDEEFPPGKFYTWDEDEPRNAKAVIIHNNWILGKKAKRDRFESAGLWKPSGRMIEPQR